MNFANRQHKEAFLQFLCQMARQDCYHRAVAYLMALDAEIRKHPRDVFDFNEDCILPETALRHGWQTGTSQKTTRLLMNLWNGWANDFDKNGDAFSSALYTVDEIFCCSYAPYYWEAIKLRYPEYCE